MVTSGDELFVCILWELACQRGGSTFKRCSA